MTAARWRRRLSCRTGCSFGPVRKRKRERGSGPIVWCRPDPATMILDDRSTDRQPDPHAAALGCMERFEQLLGAFVFETYAGILHGEAHMIVIFSFCFYYHIPGPIVDAAHRFGGVEQQVQDDLLKLNPIADDGR